MKGGFFIKKILFLIIILLFLFISLSFKETVLIPDNALRFRVIASSDSDVDQLTKNKVKDKVENTLYQKLNDVYDIDVAKTIITDSIDDINDDIKAITLNDNFNIDFGMNYFPEKKYKGVTYKAGKYDSLVITLGEGSGKNWWCVLFPPLCLMEAEEDYNTDDVKYKFFVKELIDKYF